MLDGTDASEPGSDSEGTAPSGREDLEGPRAGRLFALVYDDLRARAASYLEGERRGHTLQPTALVHEVWFKLRDQERAQIHGRGHLLAIASQAMRRILVDHARSRARLRRSGGRTREELSTQIASPDEGSPLDLEALDRALGRLQARSERLAHIVELRFFGGSTLEEAAEALGISRATAARDWRAARALLSNELGESFRGAE